MTERNCRKQGLTIFLTGLPAAGKTTSLLPAPTIEKFGNAGCRTAYILGYPVLLRNVRGGKKSA
jgi:adenylylsulfate kinase-like enzyme